MAKVPMTDADLAWAGGLFDGEGSVHLAAPNCKKRNHRFYMMRCAVGMCDPEGPEFFREWWGGTVTLSKPQNPAARMRFRWNISSAAAAIFLRDIQPYLRLERNRLRVKLALQFQDQKQYGGNHIPGYAARQQEWHSVFKKLNGIGDRALSPAAKRELLEAHDIFESGQDQERQLQWATLLE
jgi:hypothetical protein